MRITPRAWDARRERRRARKEEKRRHQIELNAARRTALRGRDEHTGGYGDPPYEP